MVLFKLDIFRKVMIRYSWHSPLFVLIPKQKIVFNLKKMTNIKNWHCCFRRRPREPNIFHALPLASAWGRTVDFHVVFLVYTCQDALRFIHTLLTIRWSQKEITQHHALLSAIFNVSSILGSPKEVSIRTLLHGNKVFWSSSCHYKKWVTISPYVGLSWKNFYCRHLFIRWMSSEVFVNPGN